MAPTELENEPAADRTQEGRMISQGDNFRLVTGADAEASLVAYLAHLLDEPITGAHCLALSASNERWTKADDANLTDMFGRVSTRDIATFLGRSVEAVRWRRRHLGLTKADKL